MRNLVKKNYTLIRNVLYDSHYSLKANILLTHNFWTSKAAHRRLEKMMKRECEKAIQVDYGLQIMPDTVLKIAND